MIRTVRTQDAQPNKNTYLGRWNFRGSVYVMIDPGLYEKTVPVAGGNSPQGIGALVISGNWPYQTKVDRTAAM